MRRAIIGIGTATVLLALVLAGVQQSRLRPRTTQQAIGIVLKQRGIAFEDAHLENGRCLPTPEQCSEYRADVVVIAQQSHRGLMQCWEIDEMPVLGRRSRLGRATTAASADAGLGRGDRAIVARWCSVGVPDVEW